MMAVKVPVPPAATVAGTVATAVPAHVTVTAEPEAKLLPLMVVAKPLLGVRVMAAGAGGAVRAVRFKLVTPPACQVAV